MSISVELNELSAISAIVPALVGIYYWPKLTVAFRYLIFLVWAYLVADAGALLQSYIIQNNSIILNGMILINLILVTMIFRHIPYRSNVFVKLQVGLGIVSLIGSLLCILLISTPFVFCDFALTLSTFIILFQCLVYFVHLVEHELDVPLIQSPNFFLVTSLFMYQSAIIIIFLAYREVPVDLRAKIWNIKLGAYIFFNLLVTFSVYKLVEVCREDERNRHL